MQRVRIEVISTINGFFFLVILEKQIDNVCKGFFVHFDLNTYLE